MKSPRQVGPHRGCKPGALSPNTAGVMLSRAGHDLRGQIIFYPMISEAQQKVEECSCRQATAVTLLKVPLLSLSVFCHILGGALWIFFVKFLS